MSTSPKSGLVVPNPQAPRTLGILAIVFASVLIVQDTCTGVSTAYSPVFMRMMQIYFRTLQHSIDEDQAADLREKERKVAAAKDETARAAAQADLDAFKQRPKPIIMTSGVDQMEQLRDPIIARFTWASLATGVALNVLMLAGGIGLLQLKGWGRKLSLGVAGFKVARLAVLLFVSVVWVVPKQAEYQRAAFKKSEEQIKAAGPNPAGPQIQQIAMMSSMIAYGSVVIYYLVAPVFPIVLLVALNRPRVRAAFISAEAARARGEDTW